MEQKIQELTEKIYREGVQKGDEQAKKIVDDARKKAAELVAEASEQAKKIVDDARKQAEELKRISESELRMASVQALGAIKQKVLDLITARLIDEPNRQSFSDPSVIRELILTLLQNWKHDSRQAVELEALLPETKRAEMEKGFEKSISDLLKKGVRIDFSQSVKSGFRIGPAGGSFKVSFTEEDFAEFIKEYLRPRSRQFLFG